MIEWTLDRLVRFALARPLLVVALGLSTAIVAVYAFTLPLDLSFSGVMNREHPEVIRYFAASEKYGLGGIVPLLIEGPEEKLDQAVIEVRLALDGLDEVRSVLVPPPRDWLLSRAAWVVDADVFDAWVALASGAASLDGSRAIKASLEAMEARLSPKAPIGSRLITIVMARDTFMMALDAEDFPTIRSIVRETLAELGVRGHFAGMPAMMTQEQEATLERIKLLGPLSLALVLVILLTVERRPLMLVSIAVPMLLSIGCTLAIIGFVAGGLTLMESVFGVIVFGLGVDFAIHLLLRLREERAAGRGFEASMRRTILGTGRGVVAGATTTAGAFLILTLSPEPAFYRLGLAGGLGLLLCLVFLMAMLPAEWALIEARASAPPLPSVPQRPGESWMGRIAGVCSRSPIVVLGVAAALMALGASEMRGLHYETNLERIFSRDIDGVETARRIHEIFGIDPGPWLVVAKDLESARRIAKAFEAEPLFERTESLSYLLRADVDERRARLDALAPDLARRIRSREWAAMRLERAAAIDAREALEPLSLLLSAQGLGPPEIDALPESLTERLIGPDGELLVYAFTRTPVLDAAAAARERRAAQAIDPGATAMNAVFEALIGTDRPWMPLIVTGVVVFIVLVILLDLRSPRLTVLALLPVTASTFVAVGGLTAFGFSFNTITLVGIPLLLGLAVDDGIHVVHRLLEQPESPLSDIVGSVGRSIALTTATTCGSVGLLVFTNHPGIESVAILLLVGLPITLIATVTLIPAAAVVLRARSK